TRLEGVVGVRHLVGRRDEVRLEAAVAALQARGETDLLAAACRRLREHDRRNEEDGSRPKINDPFHGALLANVGNGLGFHSAASIISSLDPHAASGSTMG